MKFLLLSWVPLAACTHIAAGNGRDGTNSSSAQPQHSIEQRDSVLRLYHSGVTGPSKAVRNVIHDSVHWAAVWSEMGDSRGTAPPAVDFAKHMVVVAAMGSQATTGFDVVIDSTATVASAYFIFVRS